MGEGMNWWGDFDFQSGLLPNDLHTMHVMVGGSSELI